jgi:hypothetical protein
VPRSSKWALLFMFSDWNVCISHLLHPCKDVCLWLFCMCFSAPNLISPCHLFQ